MAASPEPVAPGSQSFLAEGPARALWSLWREGERPEVETFLALYRRLTPEQFVAVLRVDQWERWLTGERVPVEDYLRRFPDLGEGDRLIPLLYGECMVREELGEAPTLEEYIDRFPSHARLLQPAEPAPAAPLALDSEPTSGSEVEAPPPVDDPLVVPGFQIVRPLGTGGMGVVVLARQQQPERTVALKVIRGEQLNQPDSVRRFLREAQAATRLDHPNVVRVFEAGEADGLYYLAMEYVPGVDLRGVVESTGPLPVARACDFILQAARGLNHAHERGLVHRDVKPANLMVARPTDDGSPDQPVPAPGMDLATALLLAPGAVVKLLDLGLARVLDPGPEAESLTTLTRSGSFMGTPDYMAPEQWEDAHTADIRADLYSLGCTFHYLLTGQPPFPGGSIIQKLDQHRSAVPPPVERLRSDVPPAVGAVIRRLLAKRAADRFQAPAELADALARAVRSLEPTRAAAVGGRLSAAGAVAGEVRCLHGPAGAVSALAVMDGGARVLTAGDDRMLRVWDLATGTAVLAFKGHGDAVRAVAVSPDNKLIASGGVGRSIRLWDAKTSKPLDKLAGHGDTVKCLAFSADGKQLLSGGGDRVMRLWDVASRKRLVKFEGHGGDVNSVLFAPDGRPVSAGWDKTIRVFDASGKEARKLGGPYSALQWTVIHGLALAPGGKRAAIAGSDQLVRVWDFADGRELVVLDGHADAVLAVAYSTDGRLLLSGGRDQTVRLWDAVSGRNLAVFRGHTGAVNAVALLPDGRHAVSAGADGTVRLWRLPTSGR